MIPHLYHAHHSLHSEDIPFWLELAARYAGPILELGCGTGRVLFPLARAGHQVYGLDVDPDMLAFLHHHLPSDVLKTAFIFQADFTRFHLAIQFPLILLPCNTFSTLSSQARHSLLHCVYRHLKPGGIFTISMPNPHLLRSLPARMEPEVEDVFTNPINGEPVQVSCSWNHDTNHFTVFWYYDLLLPDGHVERLSTQVKHCMNLPHTYFDEIHGVGFESIITYGDFDCSEFTPDSPSCIILASQ